MDKPFLIRPLDDSYCNSILDLIIPIQQIEFNVAVTLEGQPDLMDLEKYYKKNDGEFWGAIHNDELVGTIALMNIGHHAGALRKMFVKKEYRGEQKGVAQELFMVLKAFSLANGMHDLYLGTVDILKAAHRFYEKNGFQRIGKEQLPDYFPRMMADNVYYHLKLKD